VSKGGDKGNAGDASGGSGAKQEPLKDGGLVSDSWIVALCVDFLAALNEWDSSSPLISVRVALCVFNLFESDWHWLVLEQNLRA
jgi:hypothetical protein